MKRLVINFIGLFVIEYLFSGIVIDNYGKMFVIAVLLTLLNAIAKPFFTILSFPIMLLTFGLFSIIINSFILYYAITVTGGYIDGFFTAILSSLLLSIINIILVEKK